MALPVARSLDAPETLEERRAALVEMEAAGLMTSVRQGAKLQRLLRWRLDHLAAWYEAALAAEQYIASEERRRYMTDAGVEPVQGGPVCIDAFRGGLQLPPSVDLHLLASSQLNAGSSSM